MQARGVASARLVGLIGRVVESDNWEGRGVRSAEQWAAWRCGLSPARGRRLVTMARRLPELRETQAAFEAGELSEDQVALLCVHACGDSEGLALARGRTVSELRRALADWRPHDAPPGRRRVAFGPGEDGLWHLWAEWPADEGAMVERALVAARSPRGDWADAMLTMAERSTNGEAGRGRATVLVHLRLDQDGPKGHLHIGPSVPEGVRRLLSCDSRIRAVFESGGQAVSVGRATRIVPERTRMVIEERDRGCRVPGWERTKWLQIHHIVHWEDGGSTDTWNLVNF